MIGAKVTAGRLRRLALSVREEVEAAGRQLEEKRRAMYEGSSTVRFSRSWSRGVAWRRRVRKPEVRRRRKKKKKELPPSYYRGYAAMGAAPISYQDMFTRTRRAVRSPNSSSARDEGGEKEEQKRRQQQQQQQQQRASWTGPICFVSLAVLASLPR